MKVGIVGSEKAKFTHLGKIRAKETIAKILLMTRATEVISGDCHLGGIDKWAIQAGKHLEIATKEFPPKTLSWERGYRPRNLQIAKRSDIVYCITVDRLPKDFSGMRFPLCYHCGLKDHVKSGGCWTMKQALIDGKKGVLIIIPNFDAVWRFPRLA